MTVVIAEVLASTVVLFPHDVDIIDNDNYSDDDHDWKDSADNSHDENDVDQNIDD